jgi:signal transduction histidine kinase
MARILIVDDDAALREVVRLSLETAGHDVLEAADGAQGVEMALSHLPELVLCDVRMEKMDGYGTLMAMRQHSATASLPFILMTGQADTEGMRQGMELGADDYLPKPFRVDQLLGAVDARLKKQQRLRDQAEKQLAELRANISLALPHELLTPLNGILGFADIMASDAASLKPEDIGTMASAIRESAERLHRLIQNFLLLSHLELHRDNRQVLMKELRPMNLLPLVEATARSKAQRVHREADLVLELADVQVPTREDYMSKIAEEILDNALKFSSPGTPVRVGLGVNGRAASLRVSDRGRGMKAEHIAEVGAYRQFERKFYEQQGSGLGLAIAEQLTELHGGRLNISSETGVGTVVEVRLPLGG